MFFAPFPKQRTTHASLPSACTCARRNMQCAGAPTCWRAPCRPTCPASASPPASPSPTPGYARTPSPDKKSKTSTSEEESHLISLVCLTWVKAPEQQSMVQIEFRKLCVHPTWFICQHSLQTQVLTK